MADEIDTLQSYLLRAKTTVGRFSHVADAGQYYHALDIASGPFIDNLRSHGSTITWQKVQPVLPTVATIVGSMEDAAFAQNHDGVFNHSVALVMELKPLPGWGVIRIPPPKGTPV
jgi:hypothetical protein